MAKNTGNSPTDRTESTTSRHSKQTDESTRGTASEAAEQTKEEASRLSEKAKRQFAGQAEQQKVQASEQLDDIGEALRETSESLHERDKDSVANLTEGAARQIDRLSGYLRDRSVNDMLSEAKRFARRSPGMFLGGAAVLGFFGSRFFRSSDPHPHRRGHTTRSARRSTGDPRSGSHRGTPVRGESTTRGGDSTTRAGEESKTQAGEGSTRRAGKGSSS